MSDGVSIITCTADRPEAIFACCAYVGRAFNRDYQHIVVDSGDQPANLPSFCERIRGEPGLPPAESFRSNMLKAMEAVRHDKVVVAEDDDVYHPRYFAMMAGLLDIRPLVGSARARWYNVRHRLWTVKNNLEHASLSQTGFTRELYPRVIEILRESGRSISTGPQQLDGTLWRRSHFPPTYKLLLPESVHVIGIKGMPGKPGLGIDHKREELKGYAADPELQKLREWIGRDADYYRDFYEGDPWQNSARGQEGDS